MATQFTMLAGWRELRSSPDEFHAFCGGAGCRQRLGRARVKSSNRRDPFVWQPEPGYVAGAESDLRYSKTYSDNYPRRQRWAALKFVRLGSSASKETGPFGLRRIEAKRVMGGKSAYERTNVEFIKCRECSTLNLVVPHLAVREMPTDALLIGRCGRCPRCVAAGQACEWNGDCSQCDATTAFKPLY